MNINSQFESFNFVSGSHKTQSTPRVKKVALVASVVLLLAGAYYYGASTTKTPQVHNSTTLFRSYTPSSDVISTSRRAPFSHFGGIDNDEVNKKIFHLFADPAIFNDGFGKDLEVTPNAAFWGLAFEEQKLGQPNTEIPEIKALTFQRSINKKGVQTGWVANKIDDRELIKAISEEDVRLVVCVAGDQFQDCIKPNYSCTPLQPAPGYKPELVKPGNLGMITYGMDQKCNLRASIIVYKWLGE